MGEHPKRYLLTRDAVNLICFLARISRSPGRRPAVYLYRDTCRKTCVYIYICIFTYMCISTYHMTSTLSAQLWSKCEADVGRFIHIAKTQVVPFPKGQRSHYLEVQGTCKPQL